MAATGFTPIQLYRTSTAAATPSAGNLADGELAINLTDEKLYFKNASGVVKMLASVAGATGTVSSVAVSGGTTGLTTSGGPITTSGTITLAGTLGVANGGTGATSLTSGYLLKGNGTSAVSASVVYDGGTNVGIGTSSPTAKLEVNGSVRFVDSSAAGPDLAFGNAGGSTTINNVANSRNYYGAYEHVFTNYDNASEYMRLTAAGNLGIGTSSPADKLTVNGCITTTAGAYSSTNGANAVKLGAAGQMNFGAGGSDLILAVNAANIRFGDWNTNTERMRLDASGNVGIGTGSPAFTIDISQAAPRIRQTATTGTNSSLIQLANSGGNAYLGLDNSGGGLGGAYALNVWHSGAYPIVFATNNTERMRIDSSGNLGLGVTPNTWAATARAFQFGAYGALYQNASGYPELAFNTYQNASNIYTYRNTDVATRYSQTNGQHQWFNAPSGTAGNAISFTQAMTLDASGNLGIGTVNPGWKVEAVGSGTDKLRLYNTTGNGNIIDFLDVSWQSQIEGRAGNLLFKTGGATERARIDSSGNLLVGTTSGSSKLTVAGTIESTTGGVKFPDATTQTTKGIAAAFTQITSTSASGTAVTFSNIPQTYTEIYAEITDVSHNGGTSQTLRIQVSTDGVTYTTALNVGPSVAAANSVAGIFSAFDYSRNYVEVSTGTISSANASPYAGFMDSPLLMKITGGINYVSFVWSGGASFDAGTITLYGR